MIKYKDILESMNIEEITSTMNVAGADQKKSSSIDYKQLKDTDNIVDKGKYYETSDGKLVTWGSHESYSAQKKLKDRLNKQKKNVTEEVDSTSSKMSVEEIVAKIKQVIEKHFSDSLIQVKFSTDILPSIDIGFTLGKNKSEYSNGIHNNDPLHHSFSIYGFEKNGDYKTLSLEDVIKNFTIKPEEGSYYAYGRVKTPFRKLKTDDPNKIIKAIDIYFSKLAKLVKDNEDNFSKEHIDVVKSKLKSNSIKESVEQSNRKKYELDKIDSSKKVTLKVNKNKFLKMFGIKDVPTIDDYDASYSVVEISNNRYLDITKKGNKYFNGKGQELSDEIVDRLNSEMLIAIEYGTENKINDRVNDVIEKILDNFGDYKYQYDTMMGDEYDSYKGIARGVYLYDTTSSDSIEITCYLDFVHVINDCIAGYGMFQPDPNLEGETPEEYIKNRFGTIKYYFDIYNESIPKLDLDSIDEFDKKYFREQIKEIEKEYNIKLT